jgi:hypothetical protein
MTTPHAFTMSVRFEIDPATGKTAVFTDGDFMGAYVNADVAGVHLVCEFEHRIKEGNNTEVVLVRTHNDPCHRHNWIWTGVAEGGDSYQCSICDADGFLPSPEIAEMAR